MDRLDSILLLVLDDGRQMRSARWPVGASDASGLLGQSAASRIGSAGSDQGPAELATTGLGTSGAKGPPPGVPAPKAGVDAKTIPAPNTVTNATATAMELAVGFEIFRVEGGRYQRPYVAAWVEDKDGFPVRTLLLWLLQSEKGQRWLPDLRRWHRGDQIRRLAEDKDLVATVSGATRNPGKYSVVWDGKDDQGAPVKPGTYTFYLESAREHGAYQLMKHEFTVGGPPFTAPLKDADELKGVTLEYRKRPNGR